MSSHAPNVSNTLIRPRFADKVAETEGLTALRPPAETAEDRFADKVTEAEPAGYPEGVVAEHDGEIVGAALWKPAEAPSDPALVWLRVRPSNRRLGLGRHLLAALEMDASAHGAGVLRCFVRLEPGTIPFAAGLGWQERYQELIQGTDAPALPPVALPDGIRCETCPGDTLSPNELAAAYEAYADAAPFIADFFPFDGFARAVLERRPFNQLVLAWWSATCVGMAWGLDAEPEAVFNEFTGVRPEHKGRGIATALKVELARAAHAAGRPYLFTSNRAGNEAIREINRKMGYTEKCRLVCLEKSMS